MLDRTHYHVCQHIISVIEGHKGQVGDVEEKCSETQQAPCIDIQRLPSEIETKDADDGVKETIHDAGAGGKVVGSFRK